MYFQKQGKNVMLKCTRVYQLNFVMIILKQIGYEKFKICVLHSLFPSSTVIFVFIRIVFEN